MNIKSDATAAVPAPAGGSAQAAAELAPTPADAELLARLEAAEAKYKTLTKLYGRATAREEQLREVVKDLTARLAGGAGD